MSDVITHITNRIKHWWVYVILGLIFIVGGIWIIMTPLASYVSLAWLFSFLVLTSGVFHSFFAIFNREQLDSWGWYLFSGILELIIGFILLAYPGLSMVVLPFIVGFWLMFEGIKTISASIHFKNSGTKNWGWILAFGILLTVVSFFMIMDPVFGILNIVYLTGFALIFFGFGDLTMAFEFKKIKTTITKAPEELQKKFTEFADELHKNILSHIGEISPESKEKVAKEFEDFKNKLK